MSGQHWMYYVADKLKSEQRWIYASGGGSEARSDEGDRNEDGGEVY